MDAGDHFVFVVEKARRLGPRAEGAARYRVRAELAGRLFEETVIDVGFSDPFPESIDRLSGPGLLSFADIEPVEVPALPLEEHVAEKVHAYTRTYSDTANSTRVKDLVDLVVVGSFATMDAARLQAGLRKTFDSRGRQPLPERLPPPPADWAPRTEDSPRSSGSIPSFAPATQRQPLSSTPSSQGVTGENGRLTYPRGTMTRSVECSKVPRPARPGKKAPSRCRLCRGLRATGTN